MGNYFFNQPGEGVSSSHINTAPAVFFKSKSGSRRNKASFPVILSLTNCAREGNKKSEQWELKDRIRLKDKTNKDSFKCHLSLQYFPRLVKSAFFIQLNKALFILFAMILLNPISIWAATYYISPSGSDSNSGTSTTSPRKTFNYAIPKLRPGDILVLMNGTYTKSTTGLPFVNCGLNATAVSGTATQPITIIAMNERQAFLKSDGSVAAFRMGYCSYWNVEGLRGESADLSSAYGGQQFSIFQFDNVNNVNIRRVLAAHVNRYFNVHAISANYSSNVLVEESEAYYFHRWGITSFKSNNLTFRRDYTNSRNYPDISGGYTSIVPGRGDFGIGFYGTSDYKVSHSLIENSIDEGSANGFNGGQNPNDGIYTIIIGSIALNDMNGIYNQPDPSTTYNTRYENDVAVNNTNGMFLRSVTNAIVNNITVYHNSNGLVTDNPWGTIYPSAYFTNVLNFNNTHVSYTIGSGYLWSMNYTNSVVPTLMGLSTNQCIVYVPSNSNMKGAGKNGADIGANIVYRYKDGILTNQKLWDQTTGQFPCGSTVTGVNDNATFPNSSCVNVHRRLNVGVNGCPIP